MKVFKYIVRFVLSLMVVFYLLPASLFQIPYFQKKISLIVTEYIENRIETKVEIEKIEFQPFNKLILKNVYLEDQNGDAVLSAKRIAAGFDFRSLFQNKFNFGSVQLYSFQLNLSKEDEKSPLNIQYIIDAFKKKNNDDKDTPIDVRINNLSLAYGTFSYKVKNKEASPNVFNPNDIYIRDISVKIKLKELTNNLLDVDIKKLTCKEKSGLQITQLYGKVFINTDEAKIDQLYLELPHSKIKLSDLSADFRNVLPEDNFMEKTTFNFRIEPSNITLYDISALAPVFSKFHDPIKIEGKASGTLDDIVFNELKIQESKNIFLSLDGNVRNLSSPDIFNIFIKTNINDSYINERGFQQLADNFNSQPVEIPKPIRNLGQVVINGNVSGFLSNLTSSVFLHSKIGNLRTDINFGKKNHIFLKGKVHSTEINLKDLIGNPDFGPAVFGINIDATYSDATGMKGNVDALINRFYYKSYTYENISLQGDFTSESFKGNFNADSPHGQLTAEGLFVFKGKDSEFNFSAKASELLLDELNLTQKYTDPELSFSVDADFKGNNIDNLEGSIVVNNLLFSTNKGGYQIKQIDINTLKEEEKNHWTIHSDILNGEITGNFTWKNIVLSLKKWSSLYLPSLFENNSLASPDDTEETHFTMNFTVNDTREFSYIFELPLTVFNQAHITGNYNNVDNQIHLTANIPYMQFGNYRLEDSKISIENNEKEVQLHISGLNKQKETH
ncbi:MAG: hypothetical protein LBH12_02865, partial [Dysgonamonadaceae bacterium]|nr:hypothetical protein [Dysgonamonadaceae bacterium]